MTWGLKNKNRLSEEKDDEESKFTIPDPKGTSSEEEYVWLKEPEQHVSLHTRQAEGQEYQAEDPAKR
jgi:hypothetical protein